MNPNMATAVRCLVAALVLGILADALLRVGPWGLNAALFACALAMCLFAFTPRGRSWLSLLIALFGLFFVWRDSRVLKALDVIAIGSVCLAIALPTAVERLSRSTFVHYLGALCDSIVGAIAGAPQLIWKEMELENHGAVSPEARQSWIKIVTNGAIGLCIAFPLLLVFGALFASADTAFRLFVQDLFDVDWDNLGRHLLVIGSVTWIVAGFLRVLAFNARADFPLHDTASAMKLESLALLLPLTLLNGLFMTFVAVQLNYFFGDTAYIADPNGPTYSEYARQGFFQLVAVAVLALLVLYAGDWLDRDAVPTARKWFQILAALLIVLVYIVMASALHRMYLYYEAYGLTELRLYTTAFMFWLAIAIIAFAATVLIGARERYVMMVASTAWIAVIALHAINPNALIVRANLARSMEGKPLDSTYLGGALGADAIPSLVAAREGYAKSLQNGIDQAIAYWMHIEGQKSHDWRTWNWSRWRANTNVASTGISPAWVDE